MDKIGKRWNQLIDSMIKKLDKFENNLKMQMASNGVKIMNRKLKIKDE